jgi:hypothetical protein
MSRTYSGPRQLRRGLLAATVFGFSLAAITGCGARAGAGTTVVTVACDGSTTTTVVASPPEAISSGQAAAQTAGGPTTSTPVPTPRVVEGGTVQLHDSDGGSTIVVPIRTQLTIALGPASAPFCWSAPTSSDTGIIKQLSSTSGNDRSAHGSFIVRAVGTATILATMDPRCYPPCGAPSMLWKVTVETAAEPPRVS